MSVSMLPEQVDALRDLIAQTGAFAVEVGDAGHMSVDVMTFTRLGAPEVDPDADLRVRFWSVSVAGTVRERDSETAVAA